MDIFQFVFKIVGDLIVFTRNTVIFQFGLLPLTIFGFLMMRFVINVLLDMALFFIQPVSKEIGFDKGYRAFKGKGKWRWKR